MRGKVAHITVDGEPLCLNDKLIRQAKTTCGHRTITAAKEGKRAVWKHVEGHRVKVVIGHCPTY